MRNTAKIYACLTLVIVFNTNAQERSQYQHWLELASADQTYADRSGEIGRTEAFREFLGQDSIVFREGRGPVDALEEYLSANYRADELTWESHYIDVSRDGDLGLTAGPYEIVDRTRESDQYFFGHLVSIWKRDEGEWELVADIAAGIPGFLRLNVEPNFDDTRPVLDETAEQNTDSLESNDMQSLADADNLFGLSINFRGGQRALLRYGLESTRVYLPGMAPAIGTEASSVYGAYLDNEISTSNPINLTHMGGFLSSSREMGYTFGVMQTDNSPNEVGFRAGYLRQWRFKKNNEWGIAVEVLRPL
tara:strand:- start:3 stop:920 length:918 start_codon:yes stop_codon:yes gene_type:complete